MDRRLDQHMESHRDAYGAGRDLHLHVGTHVGPDTGHGQGGVGRWPAYDRDRPLFMQYFNPEVLACYGLSAAVQMRRVLELSLRATRLAVLLTDASLLFPASYLFEVPGFSRFLDDVAPLGAWGSLSYIAPVGDLAVYRDIKAAEYRHDEVNPYAGKGAAVPERDYVWQPRFGHSTAVDIAAEWRAALAGDGALGGVVEAVSRRWGGRGGNAEQALHSVPDRLAGQALVGRLVQQVIPVGLTPGETARIDMLLSRAYLLSYLQELRANMLVDFSHADLSCGLSGGAESGSYSLLSARRFDLALQWLGLHDYVYRTAAWTDLMLLRSMPEFGALTLALYEQNAATSLRSAVVHIRQAAELKPAINLTQAQRNVSAVASRVC